MSDAKTMIKKVINNAILVRLIAIAFIALAFGAANWNYLKFQNLGNLMTNISPYFIMSIGITFVLMIGSIDLSIGTMASLSAVVTALLLPKIGIWAFIPPILLGILGGAINGFLISKLKLPSFIATLGTMGIWSSTAYWISGNKAVTFSRELWIYVDWFKINFGIIPVVFIGCIIIWGILYIIQNLTSFGKGVFATGVNERAAQVAGVNVVWIKMLAFTISGLLSALAGILLVVKSKGAVPYSGDAMTLLAITAVVLGGTALEGGKGGMLFTLLGSAMVVMIQNGLNIVGITTFYQDIVFGLLIILAVFSSADRSNRYVLVK